MPELMSSQRAYCPRCGACARPGTPPVCPEHGPIWQLSRSAPCASVIMVHGDALLLTLRARAPWRGWWEIPGGFQDAGEHPEDGARREIAEELGVEAELLGLLGIYIHEAGGEHRQVTTYVGRCEGEPYARSAEVAGLRWFRSDSLPDRLIPNHRRRIDDLLVDARYAAWAAGDYPPLLAETVASPRTPMPS